MLEGSVRRAANRVRINAQLIDAATGFHLWAQRYDRDFEDIFALQDEIVHAIVAALEVRLTARERAGIERRYTDNLEAYDLFLQAREGFWRRTQEGAAQARTSLERAIVLDPKFAAAHALLADIYRSEWWYGWRDDEDALDRALELARRGVALDDGLPFAHMFLGWIHLWRKEHDQAIAEAKRCLALDPNNAEGHVRLGHMLDLAGRPAEGLPLIETAMRLDPHYPSMYLFWLGHAFHSLERYDEAVAAYRRAISRSPDFLSARLFLAAACAQQGRMEEARYRSGGGAADRSIQVFVRLSVARSVCLSRTRRARAPARWHAQGGPAGVRHAYSRGRLSRHNGAPRRASVFFFVSFHPSKSFFISELL